MKYKASVFLILIIATAVFFCGCASNNSPAKPADLTSHIAYSVSDDGVLSVDEISYSYSLCNVSNEGKNGSVKLSEIVMKDGEDEVYTTLASPEKPLSGVVFAPGAGVSANAHKNRSISYAESGIAFMVVDIRGNGGKSEGVSLDFQHEYETAVKGMTPQYYRIIFDLISAKDYLKEIYGESFPVYIAGSSNGGRYAAIAAGIDSEFEGYFGISTSGYEWENNKNGEAVDLFIKSINPDSYIGMIKPSKTVIFHAPDDSVIDFESGMSLYNKAEEPKDFVAFNGTHGINSEVDEYIKTLLAED